MLELDQVDKTFLQIIGLASFLFKLNASFVLMLHVSLQNILYI